MPNFRRGAEEIQKAADSVRSGGGNRDYKPFVPSIFWKDGEHSYVLVLNPISDIPTFLYHGFLPLDDGRYAQLVARTDKGFGEKMDPIEERWGYVPKATNLMVAVELDSLTESVNGRTRAIGFEVKTRTFERRVRNEDGDLTEEREEVTAPCIGIIAQSPLNFGSVLVEKDAEDCPINEAAMRIKRLGGEGQTIYQMDQYPDVEVNLDGLFDNLTNVSYIDDLDLLLVGIERCTDDFQANALIGKAIIDKRIDELTDGAYYDEVLESISRPSRYAKEEKGKGATKKAPTVRPTRPSQRKAVAEAGPVDVDEPQVEVTQAKPRSRRRAPDEETSSASPEADDGLDKLRKRTAELAAA